jgi:tetratricopeptide (TPR) repeat protein
MCPSCKQLTQFDTTDFESATQSSIESLADTVAALLDGDSTRSVDLDEEGNLCVDGAVPAHTIESSCLEEVQSHFAFLHAAGEDELIRQVVQRFEKPEYEYVFAVCNALAQGYQGKIDDSIAAWRRALAKVPDSEFATRRLAAALAMRKQYSESVEVYRKLMDMIDNRDAQFEILQYINELQLFGKLFADAVASYEQMIEFQPSLAENKAFMKQVDKARKKAGLMKAA